MKPKQIENGLFLGNGEDMENIKLNKMAIKPMTPLLLGMAFPPMISMLIQSLYNIVDSMFVAQVSENALTAVSLAFPIQSLIIAVSVGIGVGVNSYISRKLGEHDHMEANSTAMHGMLLATLASLLFVIFGLFGTEWFLQMFTSDASILDDAISYMHIVVYFSFTSFYYILIEKIFQSTGNMMVPMCIQGVGALTNILLDPILIFGYFGCPALGVSGAAIATILAQFLSMGLSFYFLLCKKQEVTFDVKRFKYRSYTVKQILSIAIPNACMNALGSFLVMGLNSILVQFSNTAVSLYGVYYKLQTFVFMPASGLTQGAMPIMGFNYGSKDRKRLVDCLKISILVTFLIMCIGVLLFQFVPSQLLRLFNASEDMLNIGIPALRIISISYLPATLGFILPTLFQSMGRGIESLLVFLLRQFVITMPLSYVLSNILGIEGIWISFIVAETLAALVSILFFIRIYKKESIFQAQANEGKETM